MHIIQNDKLIIKARYDLEEMKTTGEVYSKVEGTGDILVGTIDEDPRGTGSLKVLEEYAGRDYITEEYEKLREEFASFANMWAARASRGTY